MLSLLNPSITRKKSCPPPQVSFTCGYGRIGTLHLSSKWGGKRAEAAAAALGMEQGPQCHSGLGDEFSGGHWGEARWEMAGWSARLSAALVGSLSYAAEIAAVPLALSVWLRLLFFPPLSAVNPALVQKSPPKKLLNKVKLPDTVQR